MKTSKYFRRLITSKVFKQDLRKSQKFIFKNNTTNERRIQMNQTNTNRKLRNQVSATILLLIILTSQLFFSGCGDTGITDSQMSGSNVSAAGKNEGEANYKDSRTISIDLSIKFKKESLTVSKFLESNNGNTFNSIVSITRELQPGEELDLQNLQPSGIFGLYLRADDMFTLSNSDGMSFSSLTVLMEKCSFKDLKIKNESQKLIKVTGFVAGE